MISDAALHRAAPRVGIGVALLGTGVLYFVNPNTTHIPLCPLHAMTGWWCPLCGGTRAVHAVLHGQFRIAAQDNALLLIGLPLLVARCWYRARTRPGAALPAWAIVAFVLIGLGFSVLRNLPAGSWLAPPG